MKSKRSRLALLGILALALSVTAGLTVSDVAAAKKKKGKAGGTVDITQPVNAAIPNAVQTGPTTVTNGVVTSAISVGGKKFKGTKVRDVNVTVQTTGAQAGAAADLVAMVTSPGGAAVGLFGFLGGQNIGPLTLDDETAVALQFTAPPARNPEMLASPYAGTAQPFCFQAFGGCSLSEMDNSAVTGTWTLAVLDFAAGAGSTSVLNSWRLNVLAGKAFATK